MMGQRGESAWATSARVQGRSSGFSASPPTGTEAGGLFPLQEVRMAAKRKKAAKKTSKKASKKKASKKK